MHWETVAIAMAGWPARAQRPGSPARPNRRLDGRQDELADQLVETDLAALRVIIERLEESFTEGRAKVAEMELTALAPLDHPTKAVRSTWLVRLRSAIKLKSSTGVSRDSRNSNPGCAHGYPDQPAGLRAPPQSSDRPPNASDTCCGSQSLRP